MINFTHNMEYITRDYKEVSSFRWHKIFLHDYEIKDIVRFIDLWREGDPTFRKMSKEDMNSQPNYFLKG